MCGLNREVIVIGVGMVSKDLLVCVRTVFYIILPIKTVVCSLGAVLSHYLLTFLIPTLLHGCMILKFIMRSLFQWNSHHTTSKCVITFAQ